MLKERIRNLNIDLLAKDINSFKNKKKYKINYVRIESNIDFKKFSKNVSYELIVKRNKYKLVKIWGQDSTWIKAKKSVAEWSLRKGMIIGNMITLRGDNNLDRFYKLLFLISLPRDNKLFNNNKKSLGKIGIDGNNSESLIVINDWPMSDYMERHWSGDMNLDRQMEEIRELKLLGVGMNISIKQNYNNNWILNYLLIPTKKRYHSLMVKTLSLINWV